jgi:hypothetical protein
MRALQQILLKLMMMVQHYEFRNELGRLTIQVHENANFPTPHSSSQQVFMLTDERRQPCHAG